MGLECPAVTQDGDNAQLIALYDATGIGVEVAKCRVFLIGGVLDIENQHRAFAGFVFTQVHPQVGTEIGILLNGKGLTGGVNRALGFL